MLKICFVGQVENDSYISGPGQVLGNIVEQVSKKRDVFFINTYSKTIFQKLCVFFKIFVLVFKHDYVINVHTFGYFIPYLICIISKFNHRNKYYMTLHGISSLEYEISDLKITKKQLFLENKIIKEFPNIIVVSHFLKNYISNNFFRDDNVYVVENGTNISNVYNVNDGNCISLLLAGGIDPRKGVLETCSLVLELSTLGFDVKLIVCGPIKSQKLFNEFNQFIVDNELSSRISYIGTINHDYLLDVMSKCSYTICLSKFDTFNLTILESLSVGTPIIVTDNAGVSEIINDDCGLVLGSLWNLNDVVNFIDVNKENYQSRCEKAYALSKNYSWNKISEKYIEVFEGAFND